ncbi:MAG: VacJ family lipoprotein [Proteobacteria bacterium]|nr:VacJ family lipoprotein [Pseudomonadota bacterium]
MTPARAPSRVLAAVLALVLSACAQQGGSRPDAASTGTVVAAPADNPTASTATPAPADAATPVAPIAATAVAEPATAPATAQNATTGNAAPATSADADFQALYGDSAGVNAGAVAQGALQPWDPWEKFNRKMHAINSTVDHAMIHPVAVTYVHVVPRPLRTGVSNFFHNITGPSNIVNSLLQGKPSQAGNSLFRFLVNSTFGIGGIFDVATRMHIPDKSNDFGKTFATWGWKNSRYLELPVFGPRTVRDAAGMAGDIPLTPLPASRSVVGQVALRTINVVNIRAQLLSTDALREGAVDDYRLLRDAWWQRRNYQIWGDNTPDASSQLPDYLQTTPAPAKPD